MVGRPVVSGLGKVKALTGNIIKRRKTKENQTEIRWSHCRLRQKGEARINCELGGYFHS